MEGYMLDSRVMPKKLDLGRSADFCIGEAITHYEASDEPNPLGLRDVMGYFLPAWQRGLVWSHDQNVKLIESLWLGIPIGTYTFNRFYGSDHNNLLIDGQQRMNAVEMYLNDKFSVFGYKWSETTRVDKRFFKYSSKFPCYITNSDNEEYLKGYYNLMNFSGVAHTEDQRA